jgi:hypothetical protein
MTTQLFLKRFFLLTALVALTLPQGCGDDDPVDDPASNTNTEPQPTPEPEPEPERHAIEFAPSFSGATGHSQIGVFAFDTSTKWDEWAQPDLMHDIRVEKDGSGVWNYDPIVYWPSDGSFDFSFMAYAPYATASNGLSVSDASHVGAPVLRYEMPSATDCHTDICLATPVLDIRNRQEAVGLEFRSVMSKIGFRIKGQGNKVSNIAVRGIQWQGEIALNADDQGSMTWTQVLDFSTTEYQAKLNYDEGHDYVTATETMTDVTAKDGYLYLIPQNITYNARIVVTVDGDKLGFPFVDMAQILPGKEYIIDLEIPGNKLLDYTDNAMPAFLLAPTDAAEAANIDWNDAKAACEASGYRLPTYNEGLMTLFYMNGIEGNNLRFASYWTSTTSLEDPTGESAMGYNIMPWMGLYMPKAGITAARCVKDVPEGGKKYPYVDSTLPDGPVIVSRDNDGGVIPSAFNVLYDAERPVFHENWTTTPDHDGNTDADRISRKLQVANTDATAGKVVWSGFSCPEGWRKPTMMEMALIFTMGRAPESSYGADNAPVTETPLYKVEGFTPLNADYYWVASMSAGRGGRNPATWSFGPTPRSGLGTIVGPDANYVRCVRDIE